MTIFQPTTRLANRIALTSSIALKTRKKSSRAHEIDQLGAWDTRSNFPLSEEQSSRRGTLIPVLKKSQVGICSDVGRRKYQEDSYTVCEPLPGNLLALAVFDGHGGADCSQFCSENFERFLKHRLLLTRQKNDDSVVDADKEDLEEILRQTLMDLDAAFCRHWRPKKQLAPGSTATVALIRGGYELVTGHIGDSVAILCRGKEARRLTVDHDPSIPEERDRIIAAGGEIISDGKATLRVNGRLNMSRAIGDIELKPFGVVSTPDIARRNLKHGKDKFLALITDGIATALSDQEIIDCILDCGDVHHAASRLVDQALMYSCEDNATALILPLGSWGKPEEGSPNHSFSLGRNIMSSARYN